MDWKPVLNPLGYGYPPGFDPNALYEFKYSNSDKVHQGRLANASPLQNIAGLMWREIKEAAPARDWTKISAYRSR